MKHKEKECNYTCKCMSGTCTVFLKIMSWFTCTVKIFVLSCWLLKLELLRSFSCIQNCNQNQPKEYLFSAHIKWLQNYVTSLRALSFFILIFWPAVKSELHTVVACVYMKFRKSCMYHNTNKQRMNLLS